MPAPLAEDVTEDEIEYLMQVHTAWGLFGEKAQQFGMLFNQTYAVRDRLFEALEDAGAGTAFEDTAEALERLVPPQRFQADNERMVQTARELVRVDSQIIQALADQDAVAFFVINAELAEVSFMGNLDLSPAVCNAAAGPDIPRPVPGCGGGEALPGGGYGTQLKDIIGQFNAKFIGRSLAVFLPPVLLPEEVPTLLEMLQPAAVEAIDEALAQVKALDPPDELASDHQLLIKYLEDQRDVGRNVPLVTEDANMTMMLERLNRVRLVYCDARAAFSPAIKPIVDRHFADPRGEFCGGR